MWVGRQLQTNKILFWAPLITVNIVLFLSFRTDGSGQTVQTQIRLLLEEQSDQGLPCLLFRLHLLDTFLNGKATLFKFKDDYNNIFCVRMFGI